MSKKVLSYLVFLAGLSVMWSCKEQPPIVLDDPIQPPEPSIHIIDQYYYVQYNEGKNQDTVTFEVLDDTTQQDINSFINVVEELKNEPVYDTAGADDLLDESERVKIGWTYAPATSIIGKGVYELANPTPGGDIPNAEDITLEAKQSFIISFPYSIEDTLPFWDIEDYLSNPSIEEGSIPWGRVGNSKYSDTLWNIDARDGVVITFIDSVGVEWSSDNPPTFQPFGYFQLESVEANLKDDKSYDIIKGEFAVRLYRENKIDQFKDFKYGHFRLRILDDVERGPEPQ